MDPFVEFVKAAPYVWAKVPDGYTSEKFAHDLLERGVLIVPLETPARASCVYSAGLLDWRGGRLSSLPQYPKLHAIGNRARLESLAPRTHQTPRAVVLTHLARGRSADLP